MLVTNKYEIPARDGNIYIYEYGNCLYSASYVTDKIIYRTSVYVKEEEAVQEIINLYTKHGVAVHAVS